MRMGQYISSLSVAKGLTPSINNIIEAVHKLHPIYDVTEEQMRNFLLLKIRRQEYKHYYNMLSSQSRTEASGWHITVKNLYLGLRVFQPDMASLGTDTLCG